jgi:carbonic anhydrase
VKHHHRALVAVLVSLCVITSRSWAEEKSAPTQSLERLKAGNARFIADKPAAKHLSADRREELAKGQKPFAIVLTCADSRLTPELIFDQGLGDIFVLRVAGNVTEPAMIASIQFAVENFHCPLIVVMGHSECGAIKAKLARGKLDANLTALMNMIHVGDKLPEDPNAALEAGTKNNVLWQMRAITGTSPVIKELVQSKRLDIVPAVYSLSTGKVEWLDAKAQDKKPEPEGKKPEAEGKKLARLEVTVPAADARLWIDGKEFPAKGLSRAYETPALATDREIQYQVKVTWMDKGQEVTREKTVTLKRGATVNVDFSK